MPKISYLKRPKYGKRSRKHSKLRYIQIKNQINGKHGHGAFYSQHVFEEPMCWVDIYFLSKFHKGRYFSVALTTLEYMGWNMDETVAHKKGDELYPGATIDFHELPHSPFDLCIPVDIVVNEEWDKRKVFEDALIDELVQKPRMMRPNWRIDRNYWYPSIGLHASLNTPSLTPEVINQFILDFQAAGEPITAGLVWEGEEVEVVPGRIKERYAQSRSNTVQADLG